MLVAREEYCHPAEGVRCNKGRRARTGLSRIKKAILHGGAWLRDGEYTFMLESETEEGVPQ
jgi:hypothetical protein